MKRVLLILAVCLLFCVGCSKTVATKAERVDVLIKTNDNGYYNFWADVESVEHEGKLSELVISHPVLLAFQVSDKYEQGARVYSEAEIQRLISILRTIPDTEEIIEALERGLLLTEAST